MKPKHTPGPWKFEDEFVRAEVLEGFEDHNSIIADVYTLPSNLFGEQMEANGKLIAAAPEMFELLEEILISAPSLKIHPKSWVYEKISKVIKKATT